MKYYQILALSLITLGLISMADAKPLFGYPTYGKRQILHEYPECVQQAYPDYMAHEYPDYISCERPTCSFPVQSGFFAGLKGGYGFAKGTLKSRSNDSITNQVVAPITFNKNEKADLAANVGFLGALLGYDYYFEDQFMLGLEADIKWTSFKSNHQAGLTNIGTGVNPSTLTATIFHVKSRESYEIAARFGKLICDCVLPYAKIGVDFTKFKTRVFSGSALATNGLNSLEQPNKHKFRPGLMLGLGFEMPLYDCYTLGGELVHTQFKKIHMSIANGANSINSRVRFYSTSLAARVTYKF
jgi:opacity protein-like surface antigen